MKYILKTIKENKIPLFFIYVFIILAELLLLTEPFVLGKTIDGLIVNNYDWLFVFLFIKIFFYLFMYKKMVWDTKVYINIYNRLVLNYIKKDYDSDSSTKMARTDMVNNVVNFLENDIHYYIMAIMSVIGSLFFIFTASVSTGLVVLACTIPIILIVALFYKKIAQNTKLIYTNEEKKMSVFNLDSVNLIESFFNRRAKLFISQSTLQAKNWLALNVTRTLFLILALIVFTSDVVGLSQGEAISMYQYIQQFLLSLLSIPISIETFTRIKDVINRINESTRDN